ncbi:hypothetical protein ACFQXA_38800 [Nocardiopsis composta]
MPAIERIRARLHAADEAALRNRLRLQLQPWYAAAAVVGLGLVQELAQWVGASPGATATANALAISTTLGALAAIGRGRYSEIRDWLRAHPLRGTAAGAASWGWLVAASLADWADAAGLAQAGVVALVVLAAHWWRTHRPGHTITERVEPDLDVEEGPTGVAAQIAAEWQSSVVPAAAPTPTPSCRTTSSWTSPTSGPSTSTAGTGEARPRSRWRRSPSPWTRTPPR